MWNSRTKKAKKQQLSFKLNFLKMDRHTEGMQLIQEIKRFDHYGLFAIPSEILPYQRYPESLVNQNEIPIELSW